MERLVQVGDWDGILADNPHGPFFGFDERIPVGIEIMLVPEDPAIPADMRTDGDEAGVAVDADAVGLEVLDLDPLAVLRQDGDFNCCFRSIWGVLRDAGFGHGKQCRSEISGPPFSIGMQTGVAEMLRQNGIGHEKAKAASVLSPIFRKRAVSGKQISSRCSQDHTTNNVNTAGPSLYRAFTDAKEENGLNNRQLFSD